MTNCKGCDGLTYVGGCTCGHSERSPYGHNPMCGFLACPDHWVKRRRVETTGDQPSDVFADLEPIPECFTDHDPAYVMKLPRTPVLYECQCGRRWELTEKGRRAA